MKKTFLFLLLIFTTTLTFAQHRKAFGVDAGLTYSKFRGMDMYDIKYKYDIGYRVGVTYEYYLKENVSIKTGLSYDHKKTTADFDFEVRATPDDPPATYNETIVYTYNYLTVPVMIKYDIKNGAGFFINGGIFIGYFLDSKLEGDANTTQYPEITDFSDDTSDLNNPFDFGMAMGVGKTFKLNNKSNIVIEFRNHFGLAQTNKNKSFGGNTVQSNTYNLMVGWSFDL